MVLLPPQRQEASDTRHSPGNLGRLAGPLALTQPGLGGSSPRVFSGRSAWPRLPGRLSGVPSPWPLYSAHPPQPLLSTVPRVSFLTQGLLLPGVRARGCARPARADWTGSGSPPPRPRQRGGCIPELARPSSLTSALGCFPGSEGSPSCLLCMSPGLLVQLMPWSGGVGLSARWS